MPCEENSGSGHRDTDAPRMTAPRSTAVAGLLIGAIAIAGCGESSQEKAEAQVCSARSDISKQISALSGLTLSSGTIDQVRAGFDAIGQDLGKIKDAQPNLGQARRQQTEAATQTFTSQVRSIVAELGHGLSASDAESKFTSALTQLETAYKSSLAPVNC